MNKNIGIVVDSTADFPEGATDKFGIHTIPIHIDIDGTDYLHGIDINNQQIIRALRKDKQAKTSPPIPSEYADTFEKLAHQYDAVISLHVSSELSNCFVSASQGRKILPDDVAVKIHLIDTRNFSIGQSLIVIKVIQMLRKGIGPGEVLPRLKPLLRRVFLLFSVDNLYWLKRSSKLNFMSGFFGGILDMKPLIGLKDGALHPVQKRRGTKGVMEGMLQQLTAKFEQYQNACDIWLAHADAKENIELLRDMVMSQTGKSKKELRIIDIGPTITAHAGPGSLCLAMIPK